MGFSLLLRLILLSGVALLALEAPLCAVSFEYAGSQACSPCHPDIYELWKKTPHAQMARPLADQKILHEIPREQFEWPFDQIKYVLGSHYVSRFVAVSSGTLVILPKIFDLYQKKWLTVRDYGWQKRSWLKQCAGCHTVGFNSEKDTFLELGVGCESCHGPALNHVRTGAPEFVVNPAKIDPDRREMICESCHTSGVDTTGNYAFPVGFRPGDDLTKFFFGLTPKPGQDQTTFFGDETYADRRRQKDFLRSRLFLAKGLTCDYCQNFRNIKTNPGSDYLTHDQYCLTCHVDREAHPKSSPGKNCIQCHAPRLEKTGQAYSIHDHKFSFEKPPKP